MLKNFCLWRGNFISVLAIKPGYKGLRERIKPDSVRYNAENKIKINHSCIEYLNSKDKWPLGSQNHALMLGTVWLYLNITTLLQLTKIE